MAAFLLNTLCSCGTNAIIRPMTFFIALVLSAVPPVSSQEVVVSTPPAAAQPAAPVSDAREVRSVVENAVNSIIDVLKDKKNDRDARRARIFPLMDSVGDFALMGKLTLGPVHWPKFDEAQRKEFVEDFTKTIRDSCFEKLEMYTNETADFDAPVPAGKTKYSVTMHVLSKGQRYTAVFKVYQAKSAWKIYDLEIEGISLVRTYQSQYDQVLAKGSPKDLLEKMKAKALATPSELKDIAARSKPRPAEERKP